MNPKLLELTPTRYLCPYCGEWHKWNESELTYHDSERYKAKLGCELQIDGCKPREMQVYFSDFYCHYRTIPTCIRGNLDINDRIPIREIVESSEKPRVTFSVPFTADKDVDSSICRDCDNRDRCLMCKLGDENNSRHMHITFGFEFELSDYNRLAKSPIRAISEQPQVNNNREDTTMANNNIFNMNVEFGPNKDENIASTLMGVAVKNGDSWRIYDKMKNEITDVGDMKIGDLPIFIIPSTKIAEGDLIKDDGEYYFVTKVATVNSPTQTISVRTGEIKSAVPIKNILGFRFYSKVVALGDSLNMGDDFDVEKLAIMSAMFSQTGNSGNNLLPLILFKDKLGGDDDTMKLVLMSSMTGGNMAGFDNSLMSYLMLDSFIGKKDGEAPQTGDGAAE